MLYKSLRKISTHNNSTNNKPNDIWSNTKSKFILPMLLLLLLFVDFREMSNSRNEVNERCNVTAHGIRCSASAQSHSCLFVLKLKKPVASRVSTCAEMLIKLLAGEKLFSLRLRNPNGQEVVGVTQHVRRDAKLLKRVS